MKQPRGVGFQRNFYTGSLIWDLHALGTQIDYVELLCDTVGGSLDGPHMIDPRNRAWFEELGGTFPLVAHSNYGEQYGFAPIADTPAAKRHVGIAKEMKSPWFADHMFYGTPSTSYLWSTPMQFSKREAQRCADRAAALQDMLQMPLLHENAFIYAMFPGSDIQEAEFLAELVEKAGTGLLLDLHNLHANSVNNEHMDRWAFLKTVPLDKVIEIHIAGGQWIDGWYHDLHNNSVPEPVWEMLEYVLTHGKNAQAVTLEVQGPLHNAFSRPIDKTWPTWVKADLDRARSIWNKTHAADPAV
ncbi:MAG: DUF692 family multinuclear iron-containing protein [Kofleriaceae bacterium]